MYKSKYKSKCKSKYKNKYKVSIKECLLIKVSKRDSPKVNG